MRISVFGPGALGCLFAARLHAAGHGVTLVDHRPERAARLAGAGIRVDSAGESSLYPIPIQVQAPPDTELSLVLVKSHATHGVAVPSAGLVLTLQNGLGNAEELAAAAGAHRLLAGTTAEAATLLGEGHVRHVAPGVLWLGAWTDASCEGAMEALASAGFDARYTANPREALWAKTILNAAVNPLTALLNVPNGRLREIPPARAMLHSLAREAVAVARAEGYCLEIDAAARAEQVCLDTAANISSMLQDIRAGRPTEIEAISGEVLRRAAHAGIAAPHTQVAYALVRALESRA
ncbi:MAG: 2-dehydropantoate 2-reductase [Candidatus Hydrogenedens sp.]|nr:2-dehydropantoate 2-reductase [Candidatus Hydrogenedens sp.]